MNALVKVEAPPLVTTITARRFDPALAEIRSRPAGATIAEILAEELADATPDQLSRTVVVIVSRAGEWEIFARHWSRAKPLPGMTVRIHVRLLGRNVLRMVLSIAAFAAASFLGPMFGPGLAGIATAAIGALGTLAINALIPLEKPKQTPTAEERFAISGARNDVRPYGPVPEINGKIRFYPPHAALPHSETVGEDRYTRFLFNLGYADSVFTEWKVGETPLEEYRDHELQVVKLEPGDEWPIDGYTNPVFEVEESIKLKQSEGWQTRRTASNVDYISVEILYEEGLGYVDKKGNVDAQLSLHEIRRRRVHDDGTLGEYETVISPLKVFESTTTPFRVTHSWLEDGPGQWDVGVRRLSRDNTVLGALSKTSWAVLRGVRPVVPVTFNRPIHLGYLRLRATGQAQGMLDRINCIASSVRPDFDVESETWVKRETRSPAAHARRVLQGPANAFPVPDDEIILSEIEELARFAHAKGLEANVVHEDERSVESALKQVMRGGRAFPTRHNGLRGCFIDRPQTVVRGHIASVNATNFEGDPVYEEPVDALRVKFYDETDKYKQTERLVPRRGLVGKPKTFEEVDFGVYTNPRLNWIEARRMLLERELRWERKYATQDAEHLFSPPGSLVMAHFMTVKQRQVSAHVRAVFGSTVLLTQAVTMEAGQQYGCRFRSKAGVSYVRAVRTTPGEPTEEITLVGPGPLPEPGDIAMFGLAGEEAEECIVRAIEPQKELRARLTLVPHAPEIEALAELDPPAWFPIEPVPREWASKPPAVPVIYSVSTVSPEPPADGAPEEMAELGVVVLVRVRPGAGGKAPTDTILITIDGVTVPPTLPGQPRKPNAERERSVTAGIGRAEFHYHTVGDAITITAQAFSIFGQSSAETEPLPYTVERPKDPPADVTSLAISRLSSGFRRYRFEVDPDATREERDAVEGFRIYCRPGAGWRFDELSPLVSGVIANSPFESRLPLTTGPHVFAAVAIDAAKQESETPFIANATLGPSAGPALLLQRIETSEDWNGTIDEGERQGGLLVSATPDGRVVYRTPVLDLGADHAVEIDADAFAVVSKITLEMCVGLSADAGVAGPFGPLGQTTARYVQIRATVNNGDYEAQLGDVVTTVLPA
ncbi:hypothetical protein [Methylopila sp. M107]|uniref:TipJ family phage tail tip protein n=1 Tax=Methylopila sp. M107 TaxID=1101190 RepID=UPI00036D9BB0|nr:hypothetical protein [Methylopila sp. M107]